MAQQHAEDEYEDEYEDEDEQYEEVDADAQEAGPSGSAPAAALVAEEEIDEGEDEEEAGEGEEEGEEEEQEDEDEEEDEEEEQAAQPWVGLGTIPESAELVNLLKEVRGAGRKQLTVLLLGKSSVGKSSLVNSLLNESAVRVQAFKLQADTEITNPVVRQVMVGEPEADGLKVKIIDTCGLEDAEAGDTVNYGALAKIAEDIRGVPIDVVLYVDRLDLYRVDPLDKAIMSAISQTLGKALWKKAILVLTHGNLPHTPPGSDYESFATRRIKLLRSAVRGPFFRPSLPAVLVENSDTCPVTPATGHRRLPDDSEWVISLATEVVDMALQARPYQYHPRMASKPSQRFRWLLPLVIAGQVVLYRKVLLPRLEDNQRLVEAREDELWRHRTRARGKLGLHPPSRPDKEAAWKLEQMYDDD